MIFLNGGVRQLKVGHFSKKKKKIDYGIILSPRLYTFNDHASQ